MVDVKNFALFNKSLLEIGMKQYQFLNLLKEFDISTVLDIDDDGFCVIKKGKHTTKIKPGKIYSDETFSHVIKAYKLQNQIRFEEISGAKSCDYFYNPMINSHDLCSELGYDCMKYEHCQRYFNIVRENTSVFSVIYAFRDGVCSSNNVCGFAILIRNKDVVLYDRIYSYSIQDKILIEKYLIEKGYKNIYMTIITGLIDEVYVQLDKWLYDTYPYFDSLFTLNLKTGILSNDDSYNDDNVRLRQVNGSYYQLKS